MVNYTERLFLLMQDIVARVPTLSFIDMKRVLVFARSGRTSAEGAYATCHCICLPPSEPGYYYWRDRDTGRLTRRSEWFVTRSPEVRVGEEPIDYMVSFTLPRFCDQMLARSRKRAHYKGQPNWVAKLDTIVHELYHIDPVHPGIRRMERADGTYSANCHGDRFFTDVVAMVHQYLDSKPDPQFSDFLRHTFDELTTRHGGIVGTAFRSFPSYPQRYTEVLDPQPAPPADVHCRVEPLKLPRVITAYTEDDLATRQFLRDTTRHVIRTGDFAA
ncbi:MAG: hypothetical protein ACRD3C_03730 [Vicinamibacterales bacterium]